MQDRENVLRSFPAPLRPGQLLWKDPETGKTMVLKANGSPVVGDVRQPAPGPVDFTANLDAERGPSWQKPATTGLQAG
ncbi:MAG: hypothetical protein R3F33_15870 [Planctomycetota bacterium]